MPTSTAAGFRICLAAAWVVAGSLPALAEQSPPVTGAAPVPAQILSAKRVFISNAGVDGIAFAAVKRAGDPNQPYDQFYAAMKNWGRFDIVGAPSDAELIFEIRFSAPLSDCGAVASYQPLLALTILDTKTRFILWSLGEPVEGAILKKTWEKNFDQGVSNLMADLKALAAPQPAAGGGSQ
jgi:hypothetical protein